MVKIILLTAWNRKQLGETFIINIASWRTRTDVFVRSLVVGRVNLVDYNLAANPIANTISRRTSFRRPVYGPGTEQDTFRFKAYAALKSTKIISLIIVRFLSPILSPWRKYLTRRSHGVLYRHFSVRLHIAYKLSALYAIVIARPASVRPSVTGSVKHSAMWSQKRWGVKTSYFRAKCVNISKTVGDTSKLIQLVIQDRWPWTAISSNFRRMSRDFADFGGNNC